MAEMIKLSRGKEENVSKIEAIFKHDGELIPLTVNDSDSPDVFNKVDDLLKNQDLNFEEISRDLFGLMSPVAKVRQSIEDSYYLSKSLSIVGGKILFGDEQLEETLASHMLSLLNEDNVPKDEKMWRSYVKFLDNLFQNASEDVRSQLFRWMEYEDKAGNAFGITDDGCLVGYKGCEGSIVEPMSRFSGNAIVDGIEINGKIPNKVGSVIQMPRSAVTSDPSIGCSYGLHVGTRDYATDWAPILILVKVNPRDVVSVPYECSSQKMRVCEYTVMEVTDTSSEHKYYHSSEINDSDFIWSVDEAYESLGNQLYVEYDGTSVQGQLVDVYEDGIPVLVIEDSSGEKTIGFDELTYYEHRDSVDQEDYEMTAEEAVDLLSEEAYVRIIRDDGNDYEGKVVDVYVAAGKEPGVILVNDEDGHKHIKLHRIDSWYEVDQDVQEGEDDLEDNNTKSLHETIDEIVNALFDKQGECGDIDCECEDVCEYDEPHCGMDTEVNENPQYKPLYELESGTQLVVTHVENESISATVGIVLRIDSVNDNILLKEEDSSQYKLIPFKNVLSTQIIK